MRKLTVAIVSVAAVVVLAASSAFAALPARAGAGLNADWSLFRHRHRCCCKQTCCENKCGCNSTAPAAMPAEGAKCGMESSSCGCEQKCGCNKCHSCCKTKCCCKSRCGCCH